MAGREAGREDVVVVELATPSTLGRVGHLATDVCRLDGAELEARVESVSSVVNAKLLLVAVKRAEKQLFVCFSETEGRSKAEYERFVREQVPGLYNDLWDLVLDCDKVSLDCVVVPMPASAFLGTPRGSEVTAIFSAGSRVNPKALREFRRPGGAEVAVVSLEHELQEEVFGVPYTLYDNVREPLPLFRKVAVGGTFDHFHNGHKKLLTITSAVCSEEMIVGVSGPALLKEKKLGEMIETIEQRTEHVRRFLSAVSPPSLKCSIFPIEDVWGPTVKIGDIEAIVVSTEVLKGARLINEERAKVGFAPLEVVVVARANVYTLSSTFVRRLRAKTSSAI